MKNKNRIIRIFEPYVDFAESGYRYRKSEEENFFGVVEYFALLWFEYKYLGRAITEVEFPTQVKKMPQMENAVKFWRRLKLDALNGVCHYSFTFYDDDDNEITAEEYLKLHHSDQLAKED